MPSLKPTRIRILRPGFLTTVQDLGRFGYQRFGMPVSGAMDSFALRLANRLVGNDDGAAVLEMTVLGPEIVFDTESVIALTGADLSPSLNGAPIPMWTAMAVPAAGILAFGDRRSGARGYLAVAGGIDVPLVLGSRSTHLASRTGGFQGRAVIKGDELHGGEPFADALKAVGHSIPLSVRPNYNQTASLRVLLGPQADYFVPDALAILVNNPYTVTTQSDRMGYRLSGPPILHVGTPEIISEATSAGALQIPGNQQPILLMADHQTTGGFPKIAVIITADLPRAAQLAPGDTIRFAIIDIGEARKILQEQRTRLDAALLPVQ